MGVSALVRPGTSMVFQESDHLSYLIADGGPQDPEASNHWEANTIIPHFREQEA